MYKERILFWLAVMEAGNSNSMLSARASCCFNSWQKVEGKVVVKEGGKTQAATLLYSLSW
jgi:hypothetical protein